MPLNNHRLLHFLHHRELNQLYLSIAIRSFALSAIGIFIPIYLIKIGYSLSETFLFFGIAATVQASICFPAAKIASRKGFKHLILYSIPFLIISLLLLSSLENYNWPLGIIAIFLGVSGGLFWTGYHVDFGKFSNKKNRGKQEGLARFLSVAFGSAGPIIGGLSLTFYSFKVLFLGVSSLLIISALPLFFSKELHSPFNFSFRGVLRKQRIRDSLGFAGFGIENSIGKIVWPMFIFFAILGERYLSLGYLSTTILIFSSISILIIGRFADKWRGFALRIGSVFNSIVWSFKALAMTPLQVFVIDSFYGLSQTSMNLPFNAITYDKASRGSRVRAVVYRQVIINLSSALMFFFLMFTFELGSRFILGSGLGALGSLLHIFF